MTTKLILKILVTLKPRLYSISSNLNITKKYIAITLSLVYLKKAYSYFGVCSTYLNILSYKYIPSYLLFFEVKSQFKINYEVDLNRILICTGAGIAPMISFFFDLNLYKLKKN
ncbi:hypothetical protein E5P55_00170 [Candidatus Pinguicoccus supinus]|uniref:NADPH--hemoprotein reductase n=1 Tax=Candidatus Pinguicoccus supinus TaxID=2529394 RepID=A0A7T0BRF9_9BACT|nr:hypothetical protein E5P55_00170 [Candidatus Pinguicoccus supinus]